MATLDTVVIRITGDSKGIEKTIRQLEKVGKVDRQNAASFKKTSKDQAKAMDFVKGKALQMGAALLGAFAIKAVVSGAINILRDFEKELSTLKSITGSTTKEMEFFVKAAKEVGRATKTSATEVVKAFTLIGSAQPELLKNSKALAEVTKQALILSKAAGIDATQAAQALTGAMNQFGVSADKAAKFTDIFATSQQKGSSFIADTSEALKNVGAAADAAGLSFETTNAAIQALAKGSLVGSEAGTSLRGVLIKLSSQADDKINPSMIGLSKTIDELASRNLSLKDATKLVGQEGAIGLLTLIKQNKIFKELDGNLNEVGNAMRQMEINTDNLDGSIEEVGLAWEGFVLALNDGEGFLGIAIRGIVDLGTETLELFTILANGSSEYDKWVDRLFKGAIESSALKESIRGSKEELLANLLALKKSKKEEEELVEIERNRIKTIGELKKELIELRKAQNDMIPGSKELIANQTRLKEIQALLKGEVNKSVGAFDKLKNNISALKKELINQSLAGNISKDTIKELNAAVDELTSAEVDLQIALTSTLEPMRAQKLALDDIRDSAETADELIAEFEADLRNDIEETADKRLNAINTVSQAQQQAFNILAQINTNKLIAIDNEEISELKLLETKGLGEEELAKRKLDIQKKSDIERAKILTKQAKEDKAAAIFAATIATAVAVTETLSVPALAAVVAILGAAEIAVIAAQPIPTFHKGKKAELKEGEIFAKILKSESVIPPEQSKKYKGAIDSMIDKSFESYVMKEYMLPIMKSMIKKDTMPFDDMNIWNMQNKQLKAMKEGNILTSKLISSLGSSNNRRTWN